MWPCPQCTRTESRQLEGVPTLPAVAYYRCDGCGHVWSVDRTDPKKPVTRAVTDAEQPQPEID